eukprot:3940793-Rhodomonas_salina.1
MCIRDRRRRGEGGREREGERGRGREGEREKEGGRDACNVRGTEIACGTLRIAPMPPLRSSIICSTIRYLSTARSLAPYATSVPHDP